jgi:hypothetical protein
MISNKDSDHAEMISPHAVIATTRSLRDEQEERYPGTTGGFELIAMMTLLVYFWAKYGIAKASW